MDDVLVVADKEYDLTATAVSLPRTAGSWGCSAGCASWALALLAGVGVFVAHGLAAGFVTMAVLQAAGALLAYAGYRVQGYHLIDREARVVARGWTLGGVGRRWRLFSFEDVERVVVTAREEDLLRRVRVDGNDGESQNRIGRVNVWFYLPVIVLKSGARFVLVSPDVVRDGANANGRALARLFGVPVEETRQGRVHPAGVDPRLEAPPSS